jgi:L-aminopeptidase/D-esterase-like protein
MRSLDDNHRPAFEGPQGLRRTGVDKESAMQLMRGYAFLLMMLMFGSSPLLAQSDAGQVKPQPRARDLGIPFDGTPGPFNAITDVKGVEVGYKTLISGEGKLVIGKGPVRTGVTAILPRGKQGTKSVFAGFYAGNGNGDMTGTHWIDESGVLETPILITNTLSVGVVRDAAIAWMTQQNRPGDFWYPVAAETADVPLNDIKGQHVRTQDAWDALNSAAGGPILEGNVGGGTGMICNGFKGGTGTSSRKLDAASGGFAVGVLVQCNYGGSQQLRIAGIPVAREMKLQRPCVEKQLSPPIQGWDGTPAPVCDPKTVSTADGIRPPEEGSIIVIVATDAPLTPDQLKRLARRVPLGLGRAGSIEGDESGDIFLAFSTANTGADEGNSSQNYFPLKIASVQRLASWYLDPIFQAVAQATEEAVDNALVAAKTMTGADYWVVPALPQDQLKEILRKHNVLKQ